MEGRLRVRLDRARLYDEGSWALCPGGGGGGGVLPCRVNGSSESLSPSVR